VNDAVTPFRVDFSAAAIDDLRERLRRTRWPEPATAGGWTQGTPLAWVRELCRYWLEDYDFAAARERLNQFPQFRTAVDGLGICFVHVRSPHLGAVPLLLTHGWPGSVVEFRKVIGPLTDPVAYGGDAADAFHVVCPALPGFGFSGKPAEPGWDLSRIADAWDRLMSRLGYPRYGAQGGDWGARVTIELARRHPASLVGIHLNMVPAIPDPGTEGDGLTERERDALETLARHRSQGQGYVAIQSTRPQSIGYGLVDSPAALAAWIAEKYQAWSDNDGDPASVFTPEEMLDNIMMYWLPAAGASAARIYWETAGKLAVDPVTVPAGCSIFPREFYRPSRRWAQRVFPDLRYWNELDKGGHFAALEQPAAFTSEVRAAFRAFR
jgi:pimeloyl-ACP methyl ester carboxylesterase